MRNASYGTRHAQRAGSAAPGAPLPLWASRNAGQKTRAATIGEERPRPVHVDEYAAAEIDEQHEMDERPGEPRGKPGQREAAEIGDRMRAADDRHRPEIFITERAGLATPR